MIELSKVSKRFGNQQVLRGVSLAVASGKTRVILGLSGSGKSVLMKHMIGLLRPDSGSIHIDGEDICQMSDAELLQVRRKFGMVFQQSALFDSMNVFDNVAFPLREHRRLRASEIATRVHDGLEAVGLAEMAHKFPAELSGGMRKRVGLARAVILSPSCVLYDEPTTGLDPLTTDNVDSMILDAQARLKMTSVVISHDIGSALNVADEIAVIHEGQIVEDCAKEALKKSKHPFVQKLLACWFGKQ